MLHYAASLIPPFISSDRKLALTDVNGAHRVLFIRYWTVCTCVYIQVVYTEYEGDGTVGGTYMFLAQHYSRNDKNGNFQKLKEVKSLKHSINVIIYQLTSHQDLNGNYIWGKNERERDYKKIKRKIIPKETKVFLLFLFSNNKS